MTTSIFIEGEFLDIYPYMNWIFLLNHDGDLLISRTENIVEDEGLHNYLFRQSKPEKSEFNIVNPISISVNKFTKIARIADRFSFSDLKFFYSNVICGSNDGLDFLSLDTNSEKISHKRKVTDAPIASIAAKYMTVFASSLETSVTTLFGVKEGEFSRVSQQGPETSRVGISNTQIYYYMGSSSLQRAKYTRSQEVNDNSCDENDKEKIESIYSAEPFIQEELEIEPDFIFNSNTGTYVKFKKRLFYFKDADPYSENSAVIKYEFGLNIEGKLIKAHVLRDKKCFESLCGLYLEQKSQISTLLSGECITSRSYSSAPNFKSSISAVNDDGAFLFRV